MSALKRLRITFRIELSEEDQARLWAFFEDFVEG